MTPSAGAPTIRPAAEPEEVEVARALFREYADGLAVDLCFQGFEAELAGLPGRYTAPGGAILIAWSGAGAALGCVALRPLDPPGTCELKRLYVRPDGRGGGLGRALAEAALEQARMLGHRRIVLDTLPVMEAARALYLSLGFAPIAPYGGGAGTPELVYLGRRL